MVEPAFDDPIASLEFEPGPRIQLLER
jgi:hypothetical protein